MSDPTFTTPRLSPLTLGAAVVALALLAGCSSTAKPQPAASPQARAASGVAAAPAPAPPGSMEFRFEDSRVQSFAAEAPRTRLRPGHTFRPRHLSIH